MRQSVCLPRPASRRECKRQERRQLERRDSSRTFARSLRDNARSGHVLEHPTHLGEFVRTHSTAADDRSFLRNGSSGRETYRRSSYAFPDGANDGVLDDVERFVEVFAGMHRRDRGSETNLILRHDWIIDRRQEQPAAPHLTAQVEEQLAIGSNHDRHDESVGWTGVDTDLIELRSQILPIGPKLLAQGRFGLSYC